MQYGVAGSHEDQDHVEMFVRKRRGSSQAISATTATATTATGARWALCSALDKNDNLKIDGSIAIQRAYVIPLWSKPMPISSFPAAILAVFIGWWLFGSSAHAADLTGAWANDASVCKNVFVKKDGKITFTDDSEAYGSGLIIEADQIMGKLVTCKISSRKQDGAVTHFILVCSTDVALSTNQLSLKADDENKITRLFPGIPEMSTIYYRCGG